MAYTPYFQTDYPHLWQYFEQSGRRWLQKITPDTQGIIVKVFSSELLEWAEAFLVDRQAQNLTSTSLDFYRKKIKVFLDFCSSRGISEIQQLDPNNIRKFLFFLQEKGHNPGGLHGFYRAIRAFLNWYEMEFEPEDWRNPMHKIKAPKVPVEQISPVEIADVFKMVDTCNRSSFHGARDYAILLGLLDTGARATEFLALNRQDVDLVRGMLLIRQGKGRKPRTVFLGAKSRKALRSYLNHRKDQEPALWVIESGSRLTYNGLRGVITRRAEVAGLKNIPSLHDFRRAFALAMLRAGTDIFTLAKLMGHASVTVLQRYLKQTTEDVELAHHLGSPVDHAGI